MAYLDLAWPEVGLAVEPSGAKGHAGDSATGAETMRRDFWLAAESWEVLYDVYWSRLGKIPSASAGPSRRCISAGCREVAAQRRPFGRAEHSTVGQSSAVES